ncbi:MAG: hypothetical protein ACREXP_15810, partial [Steroidobacteraceae bacterium]
MTEPTVYTVTARRWARGWELHIADAAGEEIGVTQVRALSGAAAMVHDYLEVDDRPSADEIHVIPELTAALRKRVDAARTAVRRAAAEQARAAAASRTAVQELKDAGLSGSEIAAVLEVSPQRVSQLSRRDAMKSVGVAGRSAVTGLYVTAKGVTARGVSAKSGAVTGRSLAGEDRSEKR